MRQQFKAILKGEFSFYPTDSELTPSRATHILACATKKRYTVSWCYKNQLIIKERCMYGYLSGNR